MGKLSQQQRDRLPSHVYGLPDKRAYPMPDRGHAEYAIKVAAIQHSRGNLSSEQYAAIHAKAMNVLHAADGGPVSLRGKNNMQRDFAQHANASMKHMADGGLVDEDAFDTKIGAEHGSGNYSMFDSTGAAKTPPQIVQEVGNVPPQGHKLPMGKATTEINLRGLWEAPKPTPYTNITGVRGANGGAVEKTVGGNYFANGGSVAVPLPPPPEGSFHFYGDAGSQNVEDRRGMPSSVVPAYFVRKMVGGPPSDAGTLNRFNDPGQVNDVTRTSVERMYRGKQQIENGGGPVDSLRGAGNWMLGTVGGTLGAGVDMGRDLYKLHQATKAQGVQNAAVDSANHYANGGPISLRDIESKGRSGMIHGAGGPRADKVPAMLSDGEYVLPAKTVAHVGKHNLDALVEKTNDGREPGLQSLREHYADGGKVIDGEFSTVPDSVVPAGNNLIVRPNAPSGGTPLPKIEGVGNPNIKIPGVTPSPEAAEFMSGTGDAARAHPGFKTPGASATPGTSGSKTMFGTGDDWKRMGNSLRKGIADDAAATGRLAEDTGLLGKVGGVIGKVAKPLAPVTGALETASGIAKGDAGKTALGAADTIAGGALYTPAAPAAAVYLAGRTGYDVGKSLGTHLPESLRDKIGGTIDQIGINTGLSQGHDLSPDQVRNVNQPAAVDAQPAASAVASPAAPALTGDESAGLAPPARDTSLRVLRDGNNVSITGGDDSPEANAAADRAAYAARYNDARARALDPRNDPANIAREHAEIDAKYGDPTKDVAASLRSAQPGSWDWLVGRKDRRMAQEEARSLREDSTARRGQDIMAQTQTYGHELSARTARMQARLEQFNKDRSYNFEAAKAYGTGPGSGGGEVGRAEQKSREEAAKATQDRVASLLPTTKDAKGNTVPDTANAARYATGLNAVLGQKMEATRQYLAQNPGDANAQAWLAKAERDGLAALDESDVRKHVAGMQAADMAQQQHSAWNPFYGTAVTSDAPVTSLRRVHRTILPDQYKTNRGDTIPASDIDKAGSLIFGLGGQQRRDFDILKQPNSLRER
jgi:hypothetical protein